MPEARSLNESLRACLEQAGLRATSQRLLIGRRVFRPGGRHFSVEDIHSELLRDGKRISLATVYNTVHQFLKAGLIQEIHVEPGRSLYDSQTHHHHHFYDEETGTLTDIPAVEALSMPAIPKGYRVSRVDVVIRLASAGGESASS